MEPGRLLRRRLLDALEIPLVDVPLARGGEGLDGLTVAFLSDLHAGHFMEPEDLARIFRAVEERRPDLICLGGDLVERGRTGVEAFAGLEAPLGVFAVPGNHEYHLGQDLSSWRRGLEGLGVRVLLNEGAPVRRGGAGLWLAGVDDLSHGRPDLEAALAGRPDGWPAILLSHHPDMFVEAADRGVDLTLSGHTHAGQIAPLAGRSASHSRMGWFRGSYERDGARLYVGRGVGTTLLPIRIGAPPEIPIIRLSLSARR